VKVSGADRSEGSTGVGKNLAELCSGTLKK
jgi:hypothetical protein